jgi:Protein of unknown function (DUF3290).
MYYIGIVRKILFRQRNQSTHDIEIITTIIAYIGELIMSNSNEKENEKWRKFLQPIITGLVAMMTAVVGYLQYLQKQESDRRDSRIAVLEVQVGEQSKRSDKFDVDIDNFKTLLSDIRSDVSFIRGKMEKR